MLSYRGGCIDGIQASQGDTEQVNMELEIIVNNAGSLGGGGEGVIQGGTCRPIDASLSVILLYIFKIFLEKPIIRFEQNMVWSGFVGL